MTTVDVRTSRNQVLTAIVVLPFRHPHGGEVAMADAPFSDDGDESGVVARSDAGGEGLPLEWPNAIARILEPSLRGVELSGVTSPKPASPS